MTLYSKIIIPAVAAFIRLPGPNHGVGAPATTALSPGT